jgi:hypothetical protein
MLNIVTEFPMGTICDVVILGRYVKSFIVITNCRTKLFYVISSGLYARKVTTLESCSLTSLEESLSIHLVIRKVLQTLSS